MDDGLYSYAGRKNRWYQNVTDSLLKKLTYGFWWREPKQVGTSEWITAAWLFDPCKAILGLKGKTLLEIQPEWFLTSAISAFAKELFAKYQVSDAEMAFWQQADLCLLVPHPHNLEKMPGYQQRLQGLLKVAKSKGLRTVIKYHPRTESEDLLGLKADNVEIIPREIAFEFVLLNFKSQMKLIGDVGTSLLTAKWLRNELDAIAIFNEKSAFENRFKSLLLQHNVKVKSANSQVEEWLE